MALALAGAIDALLDLIETRGMIAEIQTAIPELEAGRRVEFTALIADNAPFTTITMAYARQIGDLGGALPFRVAKFLAFHEGLIRDLIRLRDGLDAPATQARLLLSMRPLWEATLLLGQELVVDLRSAAGVRTTDRAGKIPFRRALRPRHPALAARPAAP